MKKLNICVLQSTEPKTADCIITYSFTGPKSSSVECLKITGTTDSQMLASLIDSVMDELVVTSLNTS